MPFHLDDVTVKRDDQSSGIFRGNFKTKKYFQRQKTLICFCSLLITFCQLVVRQFFISRKSFKKLIFKILERFCKCQENIRLRLVTRSPTGNLQSLTSFPRFFFFQEFRLITRDFLLDLITVTSHRQALNLNSPLLNY